MTDAYCPVETEAAGQAPAAGPATVAAGEETFAEVAEVTLGQVARKAFQDGGGPFAPSDDTWEAVAQAVALAYLEQLREGLAGL